MYSGTHYFFTNLHSVKIVHACTLELTTSSPTCTPLRLFIYVSQDVVSAAEYSMRVMKRILSTKLLEWYRRNIAEINPSYRI